MADNEKWLIIERYPEMPQGERKPYVLKTDGTVTMDQLVEAGLPNIRGVVSIEFKEGLGFVHGKEPGFIFSSENCGQDIMLEPNFGHKNAVVRDFVGDPHSVTWKDKINEGIMFFVHVRRNISIS